MIITVDLFTLIEAGFALVAILIFLLITFWRMK